MTDNIVAVLDEFYLTAAEKVKKFLTVNPVSCGKGCHGCCFQMVGMTPAEAIHIITKIGNEKRIRDVLRKCFISAKTFFASTTLGEGFFKRLPCPLLENGLCSIYNNRPAICRFYFVASPPSNCYPESPNTHVKYYDLHQQLMKPLIKISIALEKSNPNMIMPGVGPLPAMLIWAASVVFGGGDKIWAKKLLSKLPPLHRWPDSIRDDDPEETIRV